MKTRKPTNMLTLSKKPSLKRSKVLAEAEKIVKERKRAEKAASKTISKPERKSAVKKTAAKKTVVKKGKKDPMWKNLAKALKMGT